MNVKSRYPRRIIYAAIFFVLILLTGIGLFVSSKSLTSSNEAAAKIQISLCKDAVTEAEKEICYQKNVPKLIGQGFSMERTFSIVQLIQKLDPGYQSCHVLAHLITGLEVAKDPSKWKDVVVRSPMGICGAGAVHGAFQERFRVEDVSGMTMETLQEMLSGVCDPRDGWNPTFLDRSSCIHGMGHLFLYVTQADTPKSVALCSVIAKLPDYDFRQTCYEGVFMQLYQPLEPEDEALVQAVASSAKNYKQFCSQFTGLVFNTCIKESWPSIKHSSDTPSIMEALCNLSTTREAQLYCAAALIYPVIETLQYDVAKIETFCRGLKDSEFRTMCWARTASKFVWADWRNVQQATTICRDAPEESKDACWQELEMYAVQGMPRNSPQSRALCGALPESRRDSCAEKTGTSF